MSARGRILALACLAMVAFAGALPADVDAASSILRPDDIGTTNGWYVEPTGSYGWQVLDDAVTAPAAPSTAGDYIASDVKAAWAAVPFATYPLASGETVLRARMWAYASTGSRQSMQLELRTGSTVLATVSIAANSAAAWWQLEAAGPLTQAQIDGLHIYAALSIDPNSTRTSVYAAYVDLQTDLPPPAPTITSKPGVAGSDPTPTWAFAADAGLTTECELRRDTTVVSAWGSCLSPRTYDLSLHPDATYTFSVRARDSDGVASAVITDTYTLDRAAPAAPTITAAPAAHSADATPTYEFTAEPGATTACRLERGTTVLADWAPCTSAHGYDLSAEPDGSYTFRVRATDPAGNTGAETVHTHTLDRSVPLPPAIDARPGDAGSDRSPEWAFSSTEAGTLFECRLTRGAGTVVSPWGGCTSPRGYDLLLEPDDSYTFAVRAYNLAGTRSDATTDSYRLDTAPPAAPELSGGPAPESSDDTPSWSLTAEPGASLRCRLERDTTVVSDWTACTSPAGYDLTAAPDGAYTFRARATDAAGNTSTDATASYTLDRTVPAQPVLGTNPPSAGSDPAPSWSFAVEPETTSECRVSRDGTVLTAWGACTSPLTLDLAAEPDGEYAIDLRAVNAAGTRSAVTSDGYRLDRAGPNAPTITGAPATASSDATPTWAFTADDGGALTCRIERGDAVVSDWTACASPETRELSGEPDGAYTFLVRATDALGNAGETATHVHVLDRVAPAPPALTGGPGPLGNARMPAWSFSGEPGATLQCRVDAADAPLVGWTPCASPRELDLTGAPDGPYTFAVRAVDAAGNEGGESVARYHLDTAPGAVQVLSGPGPLGRLRALEWTLGGESGASFECRLTRRETPVADWQPCGPSRRFDLTGLPDGVFRFAARAIDAAGNPGAVATIDYTLDTTPPAAPSIHRRPASPGEDRSPTWHFSGEPGATFSCRLDRRPAQRGDDWAPCVSPFTADLRAGEGEYRLRVRATDPAGNVGAATPETYEWRSPKPANQPDAAGPGSAGGGDAQPGATAATGIDAVASPPAAPPASGGEKPDRPSRKGRPARPSTAGREAGRLRRRPELSRPRARPRSRPRPAARAPLPGGKPRVKATDRPNVAARALGQVASVVTQHPDKSVFPVSLIFLVLGFLGVQNRIDRSDPKLALAPVLADPDLEFAPPPPAGADALS